MKRNLKKAVSFAASLVMLASLAAPAASAEAADETGLVSPAGRYEGDEGAADLTNFVKISHPENPASKMDHDPTDSAEERAEHEKEVFADGLVDYIGDSKVGAPYIDEGAVGQGDRGQTYSWTGISYGDWMYVSTQYNSAGSTGDIMGKPGDPEELDEIYGGDYYAGETDGGMPGSTLSKINVKTGEVQILMSASKNGLDAQFRSSIEFKGKLYFCGSVNHLPSIYEVDPTTDALQCVYQDPSMKNHPGGLGAAWREAKEEKKICPAIRGLTTFGDYLVISCVGLDENPYIAVSDDPSSGKFTIIALAWNDVENPETGEITREKGQLLGYPACHLPDSIFGGSIWEMVTFNDKLYVAMCTGTPATAETHTRTDDEGNEVPVIDQMQSFALMRGECNGPVDDPASWTWTPIAGDNRPVEEGGDGARYPFGLDEERHRAGACNLVVYNDNLYIGEYNDTQIAFMNMMDEEFTFLKRNMEESVSIYKMDKDENFTKVMGDSTAAFPNTTSGNHTESGFGHRETQYIWQTEVFNNKLYAGTFDETMVLYPLVKQSEGFMGGQTQSLNESVDAATQEAFDAVEAFDGTAADTLTEEAEEAADKKENTAAAEDADLELYRSMVEIYNTVEDRKEAGTFAQTEVDAANSDVLLPASVVDAEPLVKVDSAEDMYAALLTAKELMNEDMTGAGIQERLVRLVQVLKLNQEVRTFKEEKPEEVPSVMSAAADTFAGNEGTNAKNDDIMYILEHLKEAVRGFDMYVTEDGDNFKQITRSGLGDPYNQGLRVFASNEDPSNPWMCIGSANPFYGTQIWRMEDPTLNPQIITPAQVRTLVKFVDERGKAVAGDYHRGKEIYVNEGVNEVLPSSIPTLIPLDYQVIEPEKAVQIATDEETGKPCITITLRAITKDVDINFVEGTQTVATNMIPVLKSKTTVSTEKVNEIMPAGYELVDPKAKIKIQSRPDDGGFFADVPVQKIKTAFTVAFHANGGTGEMESLTDVSGDYTLPESTFTAPEGKQFKHWAVDSADGQAVDVNAVYKVTKDVTFYAVWEDHGAENTEYTITTSETTNGTVKVSAEKAVRGTTVTITPEAAEGYKVDTIEVSGTEKLEVTANEDGTYAFTMPEENVTVTVTFKEALHEYTVSVQTPENGTLTVSSEKAEVGTEVVVTVEAAEGYEVYRVKVTGSENIPVTDNGDGTFTFIMPAEDVTVTAICQPIPVEQFEVALNVGENGTAKVTHKKAEAGTEVTVTPKADKGFSVDSVVVNGSAQIAVTDNGNGTYSFIMPEENVTVDVTFVTGEKTGEWKFNGNGWQYVYEDGTYAAKEFKTIDGQTYYFSASGYMATGWQFINGNWYYFNSSGYMAKAWTMIYDKWYYFNENGIMQTGITPDGYICDGSGAMVKNDWLVLNSKWYYADANGRPVRNTWKWIGDSCYYFYEDGHMASSELIGDSYVNSSGCWVPDRWEKDSTGWWYRYGSGKYPHNEFKTIGGQTYYFGANGYMATGWKVIEGNWYYFNGSGYMAKNGWVHIDGEWYYFDADGVMARSTIVGGYLVNGSGAMAADEWVYMDGEWYFGDGNGRPVKSSWKWIGGYCYYFHKDGHMAADEYIDGSYVDHAGHWDPEAESSNVVKTAVYNLFHS